jgi:dihydrofolate reductase
VYREIIACELIQTRKALFHLWCIFRHLIEIFLSVGGWVIISFKTGVGLLLFPIFGDVTRLRPIKKIDMNFNPGRMRKLIAAINMTLDGFCDHTAMIADAEIHQHYAELLRSAGTVLYGKTTYQLMESYWPTVVKSPTGNKATDEFAVAIQNIPKIVFSHTLKNVGWETARLAKSGISEEVLELKQQSGGDILVGSPSLIVALTKLNLIDEYQLCVHPVIVGSGLPLFKDISERIVLKLVKTKTFSSSGSTTLYYEPSEK